MNLAGVRIEDMENLNQCYRRGILKKHSQPVMTLPNRRINDRVYLYHGNITDLRVTAVVNAANKDLTDGLGVCGDIHKKAGPRLPQECKLFGGCDPGKAKITAGYNLPANSIIHAVAPEYRRIRDPAEAERLLRSCYKECLKIIRGYGPYNSIAFCALGTGIYGYPMKEATTVACETVRKFLEEDDQHTKVVFVTFDPDKDIEAYAGILP